MRKHLQWWSVCGLSLWLAALHFSAHAQDGPGSAVRFDGVDDYVRVDGTNTINGSFTVEMWAKPDHPTALITLVGSFYPQNYGYRMAFFNGSYIAVDIGSGSNFITSVPGFVNYSAGTWYHIACVVTPTNSIIYVNGNPAGMATYGSATPLLRDANHLLGVGQLRVSPCCFNDPFNGDIDEVRIWNVARSESEIAQNLNCSLSGDEPGLVLYYRFDEDSGLSAVDATGHGNTGTLVNGPTWVTSGAFTPPTVTTAPASDFTPNGVTLNGTVKPGCHATTTWFDWGTTTNYGSVTPLQSIGSSTTNLNFSQLLTNLTAGQTYHYRIVATNSVGSSTGADQAFTPFFVDIGAGLSGLQQSSAAWGDFNNDGYLDIALCGRANSGNHTTIIYRNNGDGTFTDIGAALTGVRAGSIAWGDFDNDGYLDIVLSGYDSTTQPITRVYHNNGDETFTDINAGLPGRCASFLAVGDFNNDGHQDILLQGGCGNGTRVLRNNGDGTFTDIGADLGGAWLGSVAWGDYDNDGYLDILQEGRFGPTGVFRNSGDETFTNVNTAVISVGYSSAPWGDYDADGKLDILLTGYADSPFAGVFHNNGNDEFVFTVRLQGVFHSAAAWGDFDNNGRPDILLTGCPQDTPAYYLFGISGVYLNFSDASAMDINAGLDPVVAGAVALGDYDNDGRLDILLTGCDRGVYNCDNAVARIYRNVGPVLNTPPSAPSGLIANTSGSGVTFSWDAATDVETPTPALTYNLRVGTTPGGCDIVSPNADPSTGHRRLPAMGNAQYRLSATFTNLPGGTYYWSVQSVDAAFAGSPFATEATFSIPLTPLESWRLAYFGTSANSGNAANSADPDGDGMRNLDEFLAGTVPTNSASAFRITDIALEGDDVRVTWTMGDDKTNALQATMGDEGGGFPNDFSDIFTVTNTVGGVTNHLDLGGATNAPSRFYRVRLVP